MDKAVSTRNNIVNDNKIKQIEKLIIIYIRSCNIVEKNGFYL